MKDKKKDIEIEKGSKLELILQTVGGIISAMIVFPIMDLIFCKIDKTPFKYTIFNHIIEPIIFGIVFGLITWFIHKRQKKKEEK